MLIPHLVSLSNDEIGFCGRIAQARNDNHPDPRSEQKIMTADGADVHTVGVKGEYAVSKHLGLSKSVVKGAIPRTPGKRWDGVGDFDFRNYSVEVKTTAKAWGDLIFFPRDPLLADLYVLCRRRRYNIIEIAGWIDRDSLLEKRERVKLGGTKDRYIVKASRLFSAEHLRRLAWQEPRAKKISA